jgi:hypothetical protein
MKRLRDYALAGIVVLNVIATVVAFGESYAGLYRWAFEHGIAGLWAAVWPMMVDVIILIAEFGLFVAHSDNWLKRHKAWLWFVMLTALGVSTAGNTGHVHSTDYLSHLTAALPPVALMFSTSVGFGVMKRVFIAKKQARPELADWNPVADTERARSETSQPPLTETLSATPTETSQPATSHLSATPQVTEYHHTEDGVWATPEAGEPPLSETLLSLGFKAIPGKSFSMPRDPRAELSLAGRRVRDMFDVDPDISVNSIAEKLGIAWATAKKHLDATKEARGLE